MTVTQWSVPGQVDGTHPLRGRDGELAALREHLTRLRGGAAACWLVEGGPGLGKSRLIEQAVTAAREASP